MRLKYCLLISHNSYELLMNSRMVVKKLGDLCSSCDWLQLSATAAGENFIAFKAHAETGRPSC